LRFENLTLPLGLRSDPDIGSESSRSRASDTPVRPTLFQPSVYRSAAVPAAVVGASRPHRRGQDALATAGETPALQVPIEEVCLCR